MGSGHNDIRTICWVIMMSLIKKHEQEFIRTIVNIFSILIMVIMYNFYSYAETKINYKFKIKKYKELNVKSVNSLLFNRRFDTKKKAILSIAGDDYLMVWDSSNDKIINLSNKETTSLTCDQFGHYLASGYADGTVEIWDLKNFQIYKRTENFNLNNGSINQLFFTKNKANEKKNKIIRRKRPYKIRGWDYLITLGSDNYMKFWNPEDNTIQSVMDFNEYKPFDKIFFLEKKCSFITVDSNDLNYFDLCEQKKYVLTGHNSNISCLYDVLNSGLILTGDYDGYVICSGPDLTSIF